MRFARGALADSDSLASAAQLLHDQCFDEIELDRPSLGYEPRCSTRCATCAAFWIASKTGEVMRIDLRVRPSGDPLRPPRPGQRAIAGDRTARAIHHVHDDDDRALGGGCYLLVGRDSGELDIYSDPLIDDTIDEDNRPPAARVARLPLYAWWETSPGAWRDLGKPFDSDDSSADPHAYARGVTAISTFRTARKPKTLYIIVATRHPRLYVIEASGGRIYLHRPQLMPGWIEWIVQPESDDRGASPEQAAREPDLRIACLSRAGDVVRLSPYDLMYGIPGSRESLEVLPTAVMPFDHGMLLLGTASGLFLLHKIRTHKLTAVPVTRAPVLCLDRATLTHDGATGDADYVAMGLEDGQLRVTTAERIRQLSNAELLRELAGVVSAKRAPLDSEPPPRASAKPASPAAESAPPWKYHTISKQLGSAVLVVETLQPEGAGTDTVYVLAATRDHAVRLFHATSQQAQRVRFAGLWKAHVDKLLHARRAGADRILRFELKAARAAGPDGCDERAWCHAIIAAVLPRLVALCARQPHNKAARSELVQLASTLASRADRRALQQLSSQMDELTANDIELLLKLSRAVLAAVPVGDDPEWKRFVARHLRDLGGLADPIRQSDIYLGRLVAWTRFVRKYVLLGHTFASKQTELRELVERNCATQKYLDALIYHTRLCQQQHDIRWSTTVDEHAAENVAALHTAACGGHGTVAVVVTSDGKLAVFDAGGRRLRIRAIGEAARRADPRRVRNGNLFRPFGARGKARVLASAVACAGDGLRVVVSCLFTPTVEAAGSSPAGRGKREPALAVIDLAWSRSSDDDLIADVAHVACSSEVHAVQPLPERADGFVAGLDSHAAPIGWLHRGKGGWVLIIPVRDPEPSDARGSTSIERSSAAPGKTPTRALAVAIDETTAGYLIVAGSDDGLVRVITLARPDAEAPAWKLHRWERMNDPITMVVLGPHHVFAASDASHDEVPDTSPRILFSCYLGTVSGDIFAVSIERSGGGRTGPAGGGLEFGPHHAQPLWGEALDGPIVAAQIWRTPLYRSDRPHREGDESAEILVVATEKGRLCLYNHAPSVAKGRVAFEVSTTFNYRFRGMRLSRVALAGRVRALSMIEGTGDFVAAGPGGRLMLARLAYLRDSIERETVEQQEAADRRDPYAEPSGALPTTMVARLDHLFLRSGHDAAFHAGTSPPQRDVRKLDLCDMIRLERGAMSSYVLYRRLALHEPWRDSEDDSPTASDLESRVRKRLGQLDPENPEHAVLLKVLFKSLCRKYLHREPNRFRAELLSRPKDAPQWHDEAAVIFEVVADYITRKLAYSTTAAARLRIVAIKELLRVPVLRHIAVADAHGARIQAALDSALDSCLRDDERLVRLEALRALWVMLRNVSVMVGDDDDSDAVIQALFPDRLGSVEWLLDRIVGGLLLVPSFRQRSALIGFAWYHISILLPLFRIFSNHALALCNSLITRGLSLDVVALCAWSLRGREADAIRGCIEDYCLLAVLDKRNAREEYIRRYLREAGPEPPPSDDAPPAPRELREWYEIDDTELVGEMAQLLDLLARMWDVRDHRQLATLTPVTVAPDSPYAAIAKVTADLIDIGGDLARQTDRVRPLDRLAKIGERHRAPVKDQAALLAPIRAILVAIVEVWKAVCNPTIPGPGTDLGDGCTLGEPVMELWGTLRLAEPAELRDSHVAITFYRWSTPTAAPRFRAAALATQALRKDASAEDKKYIVDVTKVLDQRPPQVAYVVPIYESTLEVSLRTLADRKREQWTEQAALHIGRALRASHTAGGGARYHGDVKTSHILVDHVDEHGDKAPEFRLGGFAPDPEPAGAALPVSIVPECLAQKYQGNDGLGKRQWRDVAALAMILYQLLTGRTLQFESLGELSKQIEPLDKLLAAPDHEHRRMLPKIITALKDIFSGKTATLTIQDFLARIEPVPSVTVTQLLPAAPGPVRHQLRILHLSDLHHRGPRETEPERRRRVLGRAWLDNLGELRNNGGAFDLVVFTGNVAFSGAADEYRDLMHHTRVAGDGVDTWLDDTLAAAGCDRSRLFVIPGDRDIDCCIHVDAWRTVRTEWSNAGSDDDVQFSRWFVRGEKAPRGMDDAQRDQILERQSAYRAWLRDDLGRRDLLPDERRSRLGYRASPAFARLPFLVHLIGLDSAWLAGDDGDARKLRLTNDQIMRLCTDEDGRDLTGLRIALIHHPLGDLADGERARDLLRERGIDLMLSGHLLEARVSEIVGPDGRLRDIATGCLYHHDRYPNAITAMTLQLDDVGGLREIEFWFRGWSEKRGFWHDDDSLYRGTRSGRVTWSAAPPPELAATAAGS